MCAASVGQRGMSIERQEKAHDKKRSLSRVVCQMRSVRSCLRTLAISLRASGIELFQDQLSVLPLPAAAALAAFFLVAAEADEAPPRPPLRPRVALGGLVVLFAVAAPSVLDLDAPFSAMVMKSWSRKAYTSSACLWAL